MGPANSPTSVQQEEGYHMQSSQGIIAILRYGKVGKRLEVQRKRDLITCSHSTLFFKFEH